MRDVELRIPADARYVGLVRLVVTSAARQAGMARDRIEDLKIAVSEATANAVAAHLDTEDQNPIALHFGRTGANQFGVTIEDAGPEPSEPLPPDWPEERNLGLTLIRGLADSVDFSGRPAGASVHMRFEVEEMPAARA